MGLICKAEKYLNTLLNVLSHDEHDYHCTLYQMGHIHSRKQDLNKTLNYYELTDEIRCKRLPPDDRHIANSLHMLGNIDKEKGHIDKALDKYTNALSINKKKYSDDHIMIEDLKKKISLTCGLDCTNEIYGHPSRQTFGKTRLNAQKGTAIVSQ
ncbi:unnamed protein product [Didymodactylos carnosus]|uniref:Uncharacterized protein n=1 Tax=Didymodactylos carnosus TaxID=1234261 RepID=A0A815QU34_9BILA|nr:unnamed protein product [Didymodactylos carnosus]CAF4335801.1 unnamed protein product [Didymodactylos carnosus]